MTIVPAPRLPIALRLIPFSFNGGGVVITPGIYGDLQIEWEAKLHKIVLLGRPGTGSIAVDIWNGQPGDFPLNSGHSMIGAGTKPAIISDNYAVLEDFSDWETDTFGANSIITYNVESASVFDLVTVEIIVRSLAI